MAADSTFAQIHRRMVESGEWDKILTALTAQLIEAGWLDNFEEKAKNQARDAVQFRDLQAMLDGQAHATIPPTVKQNIVAMIKSFVEKQVD